MNKKQVKILFTKILPKFIIIILVILGFVAFFTIKILGAKAEREVNEYRRNSKNKEKFENVINDNKNDYLKNRVKQGDDLKKIQDISVNTFDWNIHKYDNGTNPISISYLTINKGRNEMYVMSMKGERFETLKDFADYQQKSILENYTNINVKFRERLNNSYKKQKSLTDVFSINLRDKKINMASLNFKYKNNYYHIQYYFIQGWENMIGNIKFN